jgi:putative salt-induced outer membrane protein YdiY
VRFDSERWLNCKANRHLSEKSYLFGVYRYDADNSQKRPANKSISAGYGRMLTKSENHFLKGEVALGYRQLEERIDRYH